MTTDDQWADDLRAFSHAAYPAGAGPDPALVVRAGRRRKTVRRAAGTTAACALVAALAFGVPPLLDRTDDHSTLPITTPGPTSPAPSPDPGPTPTPSSAPTGTVMLAPEVSAVIGVASSDGPVTLDRFGAATAHLTRDPAGSGSMATLTASLPGVAPQASARRALGPWANILSAEFGDPRDGVFTAGTVPPDMVGARVFYVSSAGFQANAEGINVLELPTFVMPPMADNPIEDDRAWFAVGAWGDAATLLTTGRGTVPADSAHRIVFANQFGRIDDAFCRSAVCTDDQTHPLYVQIQNLMFGGPQPTAAPTAAAAYPGVVTTVGATALADPFAAGVLGEPQRLDLKDEYLETLGEGPDLAVIGTPTTPEAGENNDLWVAGIGVRTPDGSTHWAVKPPTKPTHGPATTWATASDSWVVWTKTATAAWYSPPSTLWAVARAGGGAPREIDASMLWFTRPSARRVSAINPIIRGDTVLWLDSTPDNNPALLSAPLDGTGDQQVAVPGAIGVLADRCTDDPFALYAVTLDTSSGRTALHRVRLGAGGGISSDAIVVDDLVGPWENVADAGACGDSVAIAHAIGGESATPGAWIEVRHGDEVRSVVFPFGTGSSVADLTVGPRLVTWAMFNGTLEGAKYALDLRDGTLYQLPTIPGFARVDANATMLHWRVYADPGSYDVFAPILAP